MKKIVISLLFLMPITSFAQNPMGMSDADMQNMMQQMQKAQACMEKIDQTELETLEKKANQFEADMKSLCASGKRDEAQQMAMVYMKEVFNNPAVKDAKRCSEMMKGVMPNMPFMDQDKDYTNQHVCDSY
jgi:predicted transcriptional regulator